MPEEAHQISVSGTADTTGLDDFFSCHDKPGQEAVTLEEAATKLNLSERTVQRWLKRGALKGYKVAGPRGPEWRIYLESWQGTSETEAETSDDTTVIEAASSEDRTSDTQGTTVGTYHQLVGVYQFQISGLQEKLEAATYRNGYLEAQLTSAETQLKLLPDYQAQASESTMLRKQVMELQGELHHYKSGWWRRFCAWALGRADRLP